jgi:putative transposase
VSERDPRAGRRFLRDGARLPTQEVVAFFDAHRHEVVDGKELGVEPICAVLREAGLQVAASTYYAAKLRRPSARVRRDAELRPALRKLWEDNYRVYGARTLWKAARGAGYDVGRDQVARLMRAEGIEGVRRSKRVRTTRPAEGVARHPDGGEAELHRYRPEPAGGHRPDVRPDARRRRLRVLHHRRVLPDDRRLAGRLPHAYRDGPRRLEMARWSRGTQLTGPRCHSDAGSPVHIGAVRRAAGRDRRSAVDRDRGRQLRQRARGDGERLLQGRADPRSRPATSVAHHRRRAGHPGWVHWHNPSRLHGYLGDLPPTYATQQGDRAPVEIK